MTQAERRRLQRMHRFERQAWEDGAQLICGVDEVGRGPLAGPVTACAIIIDRPLLLEHLNDSKAVTPQRREALDLLIRERCVGIALGWAEAPEIDALNILEATRLAMHRAIGALGVTPCRVFVDGLPLPDCALPQQAIVGGDALSAAIAAASVVAKVARDARMTELDARYPGYGFAQHKGYGTADHLGAIDLLGPCPEHRRSFAPVSRPTFSFVAAHRR